jgi:hypothetical protein
MTETMNAANNEARKLKVALENLIEIRTHKK